MIRWNYVVPRAVILIAVVLLVYFGTNPLIRWTLMSTGQSITGAKVDIGYVNTSLSSGHVEIEGIQIANPDEPDRNLMQADRANLDLSVDALLRKKLVIEDGTLEGVQFGTERQTSGALPESEPSESEIANRVKEVLGPWLDDVEDRLAQTAYNQSETAQVADELIKRWPQQYEIIREDAESIRTRIESIRDQVEAASENPLRNIASYQQSMEALPGITEDIDLLYRRLDELAQQVPRDRQAILEAKENDEEKLRSLVQNRELDGEQISELALGEERGRRVHQLGEWVAWIRGTVPDPKRDFVPRRRRGTNVRFGEDRAPDLLIRHVKLNGRGSLDGDLYEFTGELNDLTNEPRILGKPTVIRLKAEGPRTFLVTAELDRTTAQARDRFRIVCPDINHGRRQIGDDDSFQLAFDGGTTSLECNLIVQDDEVTGIIQSKHRDVQLSIDQIDARLGGAETCQLLTSSLQDIRSFDVTIHLSGQIDDPEVRVESDIGDRVADRLELALNAEINRRVNLALNAIDQLASEKIFELEQEFQQQYGEVISDLRIGSDELGRLRSDVAKRLSFGRIR